MQEDHISHKYIAALSKLVDGVWLPTEFEVWFWSTYKAEPAGMPSDVFIILDRFCDDVDAYCSIVELRDESNLDDEALIESARNALNDLINLPAHGSQLGVAND